jgi:hypothetical protein
MNAQFVVGSMIQSWVIQMVAWPREPNGTMYPTTGFVPCVVLPKRISKRKISRAGLKTLPYIIFLMPFSVVNKFMAKRASILDGLMPKLLFTLSKTFLIPAAGFQAL